MGAGAQAQAQTGVMGNLVRRDRAEACRCTPEWILDATSCVHCRAPRLAGGVEHVEFAVPCAVPSERHRQLVHFAAGWVHAACAEAFQREFKEGRVMRVGAPGTTRSLDDARLFATMRRCWKVCAMQGPALVCSACKLRGFVAQPLQRCGRCKEAWYCDAQCEEKDRPRHEAACVAR